MWRGNTIRESEVVNGEWSMVNGREPGMFIRLSVKTPQVPKLVGSIVQDDLKDACIDH
jgi:hypothetical protein